MENHLVFVTGGTGFLGLNLIKALRQLHYPVRTLVRPSGQSGHRERIHQLKSMGVEIFEGDVLDQPAMCQAVQGARFIFHLAGRLFIPGIPSQLYEQVHIQGTQNLIAACADVEGLERLVHCSSTGVLGPTGRELKDEEAPFCPSNIYEYTKAVAEQQVRQAAEEQGLPVTIARPALVYGPGDLHLLSWFQAIARGYYWVVGRGDNLFHPIFVQDVVEGLLKCAFTPASPGRVYHLVGDRPLSIREMAQKISQTLGRSLPRASLPVPLALGMAAFLETLPGIERARLPITRERIRFMLESRAYTGGRAHQELGFAPRTNLESGLQQTVHWYRSQGLLR